MASAGVSAASGKGVADRPPDLVERALELRHRRAADLDAGVAPGVEPALRVAEPPRAHAQPRDESDAAVDGEHLAVVAGEPADRAVQARRVEAAHLAARLHERAEQRTRAARPQPVVDHAHAHAGAHAFDQRRDELASDLVVPEDVALEEDAAPGRADGCAPRGEVLRGVPQQPHAVAADERSAGRAGERVVGGQAKRFQLGGQTGRLGRACLEALHHGKVSTRPDPEKRNAARGGVPGRNWRRERDSNPRYGFCPYNALAGRPLRPLGHLSGAH